jgi:hypothetical protein
VAKAIAIAPTRLRGCLVTPRLLKAFGRLVGLPWGIRSGPKWQWPAHEGAIVQVGIRHTDWRWPRHTVLASGPDLDEDRRIRDVDSGSLPGFRYLNHESLQQEIAVDERYDVPFEVAAGWRYWLIRKVVSSRVLARLWPRRAKPDSRAWWRRFV